MDNSLLVADCATDSDYQITPNNDAKNADLENDDISNQDIEEFSSFDISDEDISIKNNSDKSDGKLQKQFTPKQKHDNISSPITTSSDQVINLTPKTSRPTTVSYNNNESLNNNIVDTQTKPSSRMSSDTFETPKTIDTRASTMTSNTPSEYGKPIHNNELSIPSAALIQLTKPKKMASTQKQNRVKLPMKRLSRQNTYDFSSGIDLDFNPSFGTQSLDTLFEKMSLDNNNNAFLHTNNHSSSATNDIIDLQNQLTNCKIQIKLQNDLLRDKIYQSISDASNKQELSEELERKIFNSINSSKLSFQLNQLNDKYRELNEKYDNILAKNNELTKTVELLTDEVSDQTNNQHEWQNKINDLVLILKNTLTLESPTEINNFHDILNTLSNYIDQALKELSNLKKINNDHLLKLNKNSTLTSKLLENIKQKDEELLSIKEGFLKKINDSENTSFAYKSKLFDQEKLLQVEKANYSNLDSKYKQLKSQFDELKSNKTNESTLAKNNEVEIHELKRINFELTQTVDVKSRNLEKLVLNMKSYHSVVLNLLMKIIDPSSSGKVIDACNQLDNKSSFNEIQKIFSVAHNYEIDSLSTILDNYQALIEERQTNNVQTKTISELQGEIIFLTKKINDLESMKDSETVRIHELETQNYKLKEIANDKTDKIDQLKKLRLTDLNKKWKAAEEALSQTKKGAQLKISELEEELGILKSQLVQQENA
ncbi:hypothetical protein C6P42_004786 [Pichia californica]|nr:hypothetical protein C6P42_004786 [[Candida] californica]